MAEGALSIKLRCASWQQLATIYKRDLSQGTMFLKAATPPPIGTLVRIDLTLPSASVIALSGVVETHVNDPQRGPGVELKLAPIPTGTVWMIESALASENRRLAAPAPGVPVSGLHQIVPTIGDSAELSAAEQELIKALTAEADSLRKLNPFLVLGVGYEASDSDVRAAFGELTKRYHPDRFARYESSELRQIAAEIFILIRDAYRRLGDAPGRAQVLHALGKPAAPRAVPSPPRPLPAVPPPPRTQRMPVVPMSATPPPIPGSATPPPIPGSATPLPPISATPPPLMPATPPLPPLPATPPSIPPPVAKPAVDPRRSVRRTGEPPVADPRRSVRRTGEPPVADPRRSIRRTGEPPVANQDPRTAAVRRAATEPGAANRAEAGSASRAVTSPGTGVGEPPDVTAVEALVDQSRFDEALAAYKVMTKKHPQDRNLRAGVELCEGLRALAARDRLEAAQRFETALEIDPSNERAARELADMRRQATNERKGLLSRLMGKKEP